LRFIISKTFLELAFGEEVIPVKVQQRVRNVDVSNENGPEDAILSAMVFSDESAKTLKSIRVDQGFHVVFEGEDFCTVFEDFVFQCSCPHAEDQGLLDQAAGRQIHGPNKKPQKKIS
jgi:hypothetical protein